ncbi:MAG TPA: ROK family protein [Candidatus Baltobacteraceae bacterium]|jgi:glucokinase|nr:ROK family protein [Candidatus Baltobacteraceae bacterium]
MRTTLGIDLGGSHILAAVVDESGRILERNERELTKLDVNDVVAAIVQAVSQIRTTDAGRAASAIGIGSPGNIDLRTGTVRYSPNFGWKDVALGALLSEGLGTAVFVGNDARCATLGEYLHGSGKGTKNFVLLTLGTGIGGGVVANGRLVLGNTAAAGEFGHHQLRATDGFVCACGKTGCFEAQASGMGLLRHAYALLASFPRSELLLSKKSDKPIGSKQVRKAAEAGDPHALAAWKRFIEDLSVGIANVIAFLNPEIIALGGGVSSAGEFMLSALRPRVDELTVMAPRGMTRIVAAELGNDAGAIGAAALALNGGFDV